SFFFFSSRRRHTRFSRDWSSDVCSSDLGIAQRHAPFLVVVGLVERILGTPVAARQKRTSKRVGRHYSACRLALNAAPDVRPGLGFGYTPAPYANAFLPVKFVSQTKPDVSTFQGLILALQSYWAEQGCVILQPYDMEMGAGTFHTATFLRAIGPETWNAAYV